MADRFPSALRTTPTDIGTIIVTIKDRPAMGDTPPSLTATAQVQVLAADGATLDTLTFNLWPKLSAAQQTALTNFMASMRAKADEVLLP